MITQKYKHIVGAFLEAVHDEADEVGEFVGRLEKLSESFMAGRTRLKEQDEHREYAFEHHQAGLAAQVVQAEKALDEKAVWRAKCEKAILKDEAANQ